MVTTELNGSKANVVLIILMIILLHNSLLFSTVLCFQLVLGDE